MCINYHYTRIEIKEILNSYVQHETLVFIPIFLALSFLPFYLPNWILFIRDTFSGSCFVIFEIFQNATCLMIR